MKKGTGPEVVKEPNVVILKLDVGPAPVSVRAFSPFVDTAQGDGKIVRD
ncbi:hypothetical protein SDC9_141522 [bioreactor metagenome]|uniref:Uncharacterized protein n=1 Tax=bioreactor metagenome TaxID=1076179 RepID=A0A645DYF6_9ZZZZ